jgi:hypothetical protein
MIPTAPRSAACANHRDWSPGHERGEKEVAERAVFVENRVQCSALDGDVLQRLGHERAHEQRLPRQEVQLPEDARRPVPDQLVPVRVDDRGLSFEDRHERVCRIADSVHKLPADFVPLWWLPTPRPTIVVPGQASRVDGRVSLQSRRSFRSAKYQLPSTLVKVSR